jgi:hypothetical protein
MASPEKWLAVGGKVKHRLYGTGRVVQIESKKMLLVWVAFDRGDVKTLGITDPPVLRPRRWYDVTTRQVASIRCDICGARPVVVMASQRAPGDTWMTAQRCMDHRDNVDVVENTLPSDRV